jgi:hypothetical protein
VLLEENETFRKLLLFDSRFNDDHPVEQLSVIKWHSQQSGDIKSVLAALPPGAHVGINWNIDESSKLKKISSILISFYVLHRMKLFLKHCGYRICDRFGYFHSIDDTTLIFTLKSPAAKYAHRNLVSNVPHNKLTRYLYSVVASAFGIYPTLTGVLVIGKRDAL